MEQKYGPTGYAPNGKAPDDIAKPDIVDISPISKSLHNPLTFGEQLVGISFNPSNDGDVNEIKTKIAELANLLRDRAKTQERSEVGGFVYEAAIQKLLDAQMMCVKFVTLKY